MHYRYFLMWQQYNIKVIRMQFKCIFDAFEHYLVPCTSAVPYSMCWWFREPHQCAYHLGFMYITNLTISLKQILSTIFQPHSEHIFLLLVIFCLLTSCHFQVQNIGGWLALPCKIITMTNRIVLLKHPNR